MNNNKDIIATAQENGNFTTFLAAVTAAGLTETLQGIGPLTVLAPTDEAFAKIPKETMATLFKPQSASKLKSIVLYHVIIGSSVASQVLRNGDTIMMGNSKKLKVDLSSGVRFVVAKEKSAVVIPDIEASNGVIHALDRVLLPE